MGWIQLETKQNNSNAINLKFICDSPANSWGVACGDKNVEEITADSLESCFLKAKEQGWRLTDTESPLDGSEVGGALCPNCGELLEFE